MNKKDCRHCVCLRGEHKDGTGKWICDELSKEIKDVIGCPEEDIKTNKRLRRKK